MITAYPINLQFLRQPFSWWKSLIRENCLTFKVPASFEKCLIINHTERLYWFSFRFIVFQFRFSQLQAESFCCGEDESLQAEPGLCNFYVFFLPCTLSSVKDPDGPNLVISHGSYWPLSTNVLSNRVWGLDSWQWECNYQFFHWCAVRKLISLSLGH